MTFLRQLVTIRSVVQPARLFSAVTCAWTLLMTLWTLYAIEQTYKRI